MQQLKHLVMTTLMLLSFITASAYDFMVDGLAYNVVSFPDLTCEVTRSDTEYSGDIVIPSTVTYQGRTFTVIGITEGKLGIYRGQQYIAKYGAFTSCTSLTSVTIPDSVTKIGYCLFLDCSHLKYVEIPNSVTEIRDHAFQYCSSLTSVEIPNSVTEIDSDAFYGCSSLTSAEIPNSVTWIGSDAFRYCSSLTSVKIPNSVTGIGSSAFNQCSSLTSVEIANSVTRIGDFAFNGPIESLIWGSDIDIILSKKVDNAWVDDYFTYQICPRELKYLEILPSNSKPITIIWEENTDFSSLEKLSLGRSLSYKSDVLRCPNLTELELTGYVESFYIGGINSVKNLTIDNGVELKAGKYGADMSKYDKLECITMKGNVPQFIPTFANAAYFNAKLRVPKGTLQAYQNAEGWKYFWNIEEHEEEVGIDEVPTEVGAKTECGRYDLQGRPVDDTYRGVTIIRYTDGSARKVMTTR